jgi:hypothetical protein
MIPQEVADKNAGYHVTHTRVIWDSGHSHHREAGVPASSYIRFFLTGVSTPTMIQQSGVGGVSQASPLC